MTVFKGFLINTAGFQRFCSLTISCFTHMFECLVLADQTGHFVGLLAQLALVQELLLRGQP